MDTNRDAPTAGSNADAPPLGVDSLNDTKTHVQARAQTPSQPEMDDSLTSSILEYLQKSEQSQKDVPAHHTTSLTPLPTQDQDIKPPATPRGPPSPGTYRSSTSSSLPGSPKSLKRVAIAGSSKTMASTLEKFYNQSRVAKHAYSRLSRIFEKTRTKIFYRGYRLFVIASRGFQRGLLPTRRTKPPLLKRRYSVDVNACEADAPDFVSDWRDEDIEYEPRKPETLHLEPLPRLSHLDLIPHPGRYAGLGTHFETNPPYDTNVYLRLGDLMIHNDVFHSIACTTWDDGGDPWMRDESLDMALETLRRDLDCDDHGIAIGDSVVSQICLFAVNSEDSCPQEYAEYEARFWDKRWIFLVVNDAAGRSDTNSLQGNHWSLLLLDRIHQRTYYFDSLFVNDHSYQTMGLQISKGMLKILGEDISTWSYLPQINTPNQYESNQYYGDSGACGPFVFKITEMLIQHIKCSQSRGMEGDCDLRLCANFKLYFRDNFHSRNVRYDIQKRIAYWRAVFDAPSIANDHDWRVVHGTDVELNESPVIHFDVPRRPEALVQHKTNYGSTYSHRNGSHHDRSVSPNVHYPSDKENENYVVYANHSDSGTTVVEISSDSEQDSEELFTDVEEEEEEEEDDDDDDDEEEVGDEEGGINIVDLGDIEEESVSSELEETTNSPVDSDKESDAEDDEDDRPT